MADTQLIKGILEGCVLSMIAEGETYGYQLLSDMTACGFPELSEGTLYPILTRLEKNSLIQFRRAPSPLGPIRKYYSITTKGVVYLEDFIRSYRYITDCANQILNRRSTHALQCTDRGV